MKKYPSQKEAEDLTRHFSEDDVEMAKGQGWRDGSEAKSTGCSSRGPEFSSQQPHGGSQPSIMKKNQIIPTMICY